VIVEQCWDRVLVMGGIVFVRTTVAQWACPPVPTFRLATKTQQQLGNNSCLGTLACGNNSFNVGDSSCQMAYSCFLSKNPIGLNSCIGERACRENGGQVGNTSCHSIASCFKNAANIGANSCIGSHACDKNSQMIADNSCVGLNACLSN